MADPFKTFAPEDIEHQNKLLATTTSFSGSALPPSLYPKLEEINYRAPWLNPETQLLLAKANASTEAIDLAGEYWSRRQVDTYDERVEAVGELPSIVRWGYNALGWTLKQANAAYQLLVPLPARGVARSITRMMHALANGMGTFGKPVVRWGSAALDIVPETIQNVGSMLAGQSSYDLNGLWSSTSIATLLDNVDKQGDGYFMAQEVRNEQHRRARLFRGTVGSTAFTIGRGAASTIFREGTEPYYYASGIIDGLINIISPDPSKEVTALFKAGKAGVGAVRSGLPFMEGVKYGGGIKGSVPMLSSADARDLRKALRDGLYGEAGLSPSIAGNTVNQDKFVRFWRTNPYAQKLVERIIGESRPSAIQDEIFKYRISNEVALDLAKAKTENEVITAMTRNWTYGPSAISANIGKYRAERSPFSTAWRNSRYLTKLPKRTVVVNGDEVQNTEAVQSMVRYMRTAGVGKADIEKFLNGDDKAVGAIEAFTVRRGSAPQRRHSLNFFNTTIANVLKKNGISDPIIKETIQDSIDHIDRIKSWFVDLHGYRTDSGHLQMMAEHFKEWLPPDVYNKYFEGMGKLGAHLEFAQPMQIVDMLNRVQVLPDIRKIRRLTRNRLFSNLLADPEGGSHFAKRAITAKKGIRPLTEITDKKAWKEADRELQKLLQIDSGERTIIHNNRIDELNDIKDSLTKYYTARVNTGDQRALLAIIEWLQNDIWKPLSLATFGYFLRNAMDAQARMAFAGVSAPSHPIDYINLVVGRKYAHDIKGNDLTSLGRYRGEDAMAEDMLDGRVWKNRAHDEPSPSRVHRELREAFVTNANRVGWTASDTYMHGVRSGSFPPVNRQSGPASRPTAYHTDAVVEQGQKILSDPLESIAAVGLAVGKTDDEIVDNIMAYLWKNKNGDAQHILDGIYVGGITYWSDGLLFKAPPEDLRLLRNGSEEDIKRFEGIMRGHIQTIVLPNVKKNTGNLPEIKFMFAFDKTPRFNKRIVLDTETFKKYLIHPAEELELGKPVTILLGSQKTEGIITQMRDDLIVFIPTDEGVALSRGITDRGSEKARRLIEQSPLWDEARGEGLPYDIPREQKVWKRAHDGQWEAMNNRVVSWFFNQFNDVAVQILEKSPTFRSFYYKEIGKHIDQLSFEEGVKLHKEISKRAKDAGKTIREYLGERRFLRNGVGAKIEALPTRTNVTGTLTADELNDYARLRGIADTKELLYDASSRNNFGDAMRIIAPFSTAWMDVTGTWLSYMMTDSIHTVRSFQRVYSGAANADPDQDGRGFFFKDPQDGRLMFTFPLSGSLTSLFTGINAPMVAPIARLSGGIGYYPALGPWAQFAASNLIPDVPDYRHARQLFLPYGNKTLKETVESIIPGWFRKVGEAVPGFGQDEEKVLGIYSQTYIETLRALSVNTAKYDRRNPDDQLQLKADAANYAAKLTIMRAISQFTGPTAATIDIKVPTKVGDMYVSELTKQFQKFQEEDYDSAVEKFLDLYGEELLLYATSKTKAIAKGLETSVEFDDWQRLNQDLIETYPRTANYFAPKGSDFEFEVWARQLAAGERVYMTDDELIASAQNRLGATKYRKARQMFGAHPTQEQLRRLKDYRIYLNDELPGFPVNVEFTVNQLDNDIKELKDILDDPRVKDNPITSPLRDYLNARDQALVLSGGKSIKGKKATKYRAQLYMFGENLAFEHPEFDRIWERVLLKEVDE